MNQYSSKSKWTDFTLLKSNKIAQSTASRDKFSKNCGCIRPFDEQVQINNFSCQNCEESLQKVTSLKKDMIIIEYQNAKLTEQIQKLKKQNANLKTKLSQKIEIKINQIQNGYLLSLKQDLQAQLFECKLLNQLLMVGQYTKLENEIKDKVDQVFMDKIVLQQKLQQRNRIINNTVLYPIYHYDQRIKNLRNAVMYYYKIATRQCKKSKELLKEMKKEIENLRSKVKWQMQSAINERFESFTPLKVYQSQVPLNYGKQNLKSYISIERGQEQKSQKFKDKQKTTKKAIQNEKQSKQKSKSYIKLQKKGKEKKEKLSQYIVKQEKFSRPCCIKPLQ